MIQLCDKNQCTGCAACINVCHKSAITMQPDNEGFLNPIINRQLCVECEGCEKVCPVLNPVTRNTIKDVYAAWALDDEIRQSSSSGGLFSVLANKILRNGGFVAGAAMLEDFTVKHIVITNTEELPKLRGSKYVQSTIDEVFLIDIQKRLKQGSKGLFVGTPCQVAGIRAFLKKDYPNFYTSDLVCHGVPSPRLFAHLIADIRKDYPTLLSYQFRDYKQWGVCTNVNVNVNVNGIWYNVNQPLYGTKTYYQDAFLKGLLHRECCYLCTYSQPNRIGDITLADFWGLGESIPFMHDKRKGVSFVGLNTEKGKELFSKIKSELFFEPRTLAEAIKFNHNLHSPSVRTPERNTIYADLYSLQAEQVCKKYRLSLNRKKTLLNRGFNKIKRIVKGVIK